MARGFSASGPRSIGSGSSKTYRGSHRRLRRIGFRGNWSIEFWFVLVVVALGVLVLVPWLATHPIEID